MKVHTEMPPDREEVFEHKKYNFNTVQSMYLLKEHEPVPSSVTSIISPAWGRFYGTWSLNPQNSETFNLY